MVYKKKKKKQMCVDRRPQKCDKRTTLVNVLLWLARIGYFFYLDNTVESQRVIHQFKKNSVLLAIKNRWRVQSKYIGHSQRIPLWTWAIACCRFSQSIGRHVSPAGVSRYIFIADRVFITEIALYTPHVCDNSWATRQCPDDGDEKSLTDKLASRRRIF